MDRMAGDVGRKSGAELAGYWKGELYNLVLAEICGVFSFPLANCSTISAQVRWMYLTTSLGAMQLARKPIMHLLCLARQNLELE